MQMKLQTGGEKKSVVEKLRSEIEAFVRAKRNSGSKINTTFRRSSLESIPLNTAASAPRDEDESGGSDSNCFELEKMNEYQDETIKQRQGKKKVGSLGTGPSLSGLQVKFEEQMVRAQNGESANQVEDTNGPEKCEAAKETSSERKHEPEGTSLLNSNYMIENLIRNHYLLSENGNKQLDKDYGVVSSVWRSQPSPVRQWTEKLPSHDHDGTESSSKLHPEVKENTLKAKLFEARTRGQRSHSRPKASIIPSRK
ncbi:hypothetical protein DH2020_005627 [Rehmannia glutinosa]|uniref:Uncharacterized protein n=1 Tax=Rehmannia glutinosa TaxID=99300 RepID=A0ABR0XGI8_REHGL